MFYFYFYFYFFKEVQNVNECVVLSMLGSFIATLLESEPRWEWLHLLGTSLSNMLLQVMYAEMSGFGLF